MRRKMENWLMGKAIAVQGMFCKKSDGMGTVEIILIIVVLIGLVVIFKKQITSVINTILTKISKTANSI